MADPPGLLGNLFPGNNPAALYEGALTDPATQAQMNQRGLLAMAGSFADSAMPTRAPTPFGAILGHAAAATGAAQDAVMAARLQAAQAQQASAQAQLSQQDVATSKAIAAAWQQGPPGAGGPTVPGTLGNPTVPMGTVSTGSGPPGVYIPPGTKTATWAPNLTGTQALDNLIQTAAPMALPQGYTVKMTSGERPGATVGTTGQPSQHSIANAADFQIYGPDGKPIPNTGPDNTQLYGKLAVTARMIADPAIKPWLAWGGNFTTGGKNDDPRDLMHFDLAGDRGHFGTLADMEAQNNQLLAQNTPPGGAARQVAGSWYGNSLGWSDRSDRGNQANGLPVSAGPGIALNIPKDSPNFGGWHYVTAPNGKTLLLQQTDVGPSAKGRGVDINSVAAQQFGYTPANFPTDGQFSVQPAAAPGGGPVRLAQNNTGTVTDAWPPGVSPRGLLNPTPATAAPPGPPPAAGPPGPPPQVGVPTSLVTPPAPGPAVPPPAMPQPQAAPPGATPNIAGAPSPEMIAWAQRMEALYTQMRRPVPASIAEIAKFGLIGPAAATAEAAKLPYTYGRPGAVLSNPDGTITVMPSIQPGPPDPVTNQPTQVYRGINHGVPYEMPMGPSGASPGAIAGQQAAAKPIELDPTKTVVFNPGTPGAQLYIDAQQKGQKLPDNVQILANGAVQVGATTPTTGQIDKTQEDFFKLKDAAQGARQGIYETQQLRQQLHQIGMSGPATEVFANLGAWAQSLGVLNADQIKQFIGVSPADAEAAEKMSQDLLGEVLKSTFPTRITNADITSWKNTVPRGTMLQGAYDLLIDKILMPKLEQTVGRYGSVAGLAASGDPQLRTYSSALEAYDRAHPIGSFVHQYAYGPGGNRLRLDKDAQGNPAWVDDVKNPVQP